MSSRIFQSVIVQMKEATDRMIGVIDADSNVISCSDTSLIGEKWPEAVIRLNSAPDSIVVVDKKTFKPLVSWSAYFDYAVFAEGDDEIARSLCVMAYVALNGAKTYYEEKHDKGTFVKNIITDNILPGDIYIRAKELHFVTDVPRAVFLIRQVGRADVAAVDVLAEHVPGPAAGLRPVASTRPILPSSSRFSSNAERDGADQDRPARSKRRCTRSCSSRRSSASAPSPSHLQGAGRLVSKRRRLPSRSARSSTRKRPSSTMKTLASAA